jgi:hypothetical protein
MRNYMKYIMKVKEWKPQYFNPEKGLVSSLLIMLYASRDVTWFECFLDSHPLK